MRTLLTTGLLLLISNFGFSQDIIETLKGQKIEGKVIEITSTSIRYYSKEQPEGPMRNIDLRTVSLITYQDGTKERFVQVGTEPEPESRPEEVKAPPVVKPIREPKIKDRILQSGLFLDLMMGVSFRETDPSSPYFGPSFRLGNKWYFGKSEKYRLGIQATWLRFGIYSNSFPLLDDIEYGYLAPMGLGISNAFKLKDKQGMEVNLSCAPIINDVEVLLPGNLNYASSNDFGVLGSMDIKYRFGKLAVGLDYTYLYGAYNSTYHTISTSFGFKF